MRTLPVLALALLCATACRAGIPAGGMDLVADHWLSDYADQHPEQHHYGPFGEGPLRLSLYGVSIGGIGLNAGNASATGGVFATERHLAGRFYTGGSFGQATSSTVHWSHGEVHGGVLLSEQMAFRIGYNQDQYDYPANQTDDGNVAQNLMRGLMAGFDVFGSPRPGWFLQFSGDLLPLKTTLTDGTTKSDPSFTVRGSLLVGTSISYNLDVSVLVIAVPRLGDTGSDAGHFGLGASLQF